MKSMEELYREIQANEDLKKEFVSAFKEGQIETFLKNHECDAAASDVMAFLTGVKDESISDDDLEKVAGGCDVTPHCTEICTKRIEYCW